MPGKSRHGKRRRLSQTKKRVGGQHLSTTVAQPEPVSQPDRPAPSIRVPTPTTKPVAVPYPYITAELRMIGIVTVIVLAILIVLAVVLS